MFRTTSVEPKRRREVAGRAAGAPPPAPPGRAALSEGVESPTTYAIHDPLLRGTRNERTRCTVVTFPSARRTMARSDRPVTAAARRRHRATRSSSAGVGYVSTSAYLLSGVSCAGAIPGPAGSSSGLPPRGRRPPGTLFGRPRYPRATRYSVFPFVE